ncbi:hypothetical protein Dsin_032309 [Dipteronia sinensis]|uniref:DUF659 domain-containing protein n=1 Tax=Dipteronia sinensis TaxID=43782 RepID=A0AAD9ZNI9_9ROSI|nr:hypothetical protein Dsin_032309 [Dipteronia sinensis]
MGYKHPVVSIWCFLGEHEIRTEVNLVGIEEEEEVEGLGFTKRPHFLGPMDKFALKIDSEASMSANKSRCQQHINDVLFKERTHSVHRYVASFTTMMEAAGLFGPGYKQPSRYQLSGPLLKEEFDIGPQNVVQVVTDNASNNMATEKMLKEKMPKICWSSCATHIINLMLEVDDGDDEVEPGTGPTWQLVDEAIRADEMTQPRRSARVRIDLEEDFESEDEPVEEDNFEY